MAFSNYVFIDPDTGKAPASLIPSSGGAGWLDMFGDAVTAGDNDYLGTDVASIADDFTDTSTIESYGGSALTWTALLGDRAIVSSELATSSTGGLAKAIGAGDFIVGARLGMDRNFQMNSNSLYDMIGLAYISDTSNATGAFEGVHYYLSNDHPFEGWVAPMYGASWAVNHQTAPNYENVLGSVVWDFWLQRTGTTLYCYACPAGGIPQLINATGRTVSSGTGYIAFRFHTGTAATLFGSILGYREASSLPWRG